MGPDLDANPPPPGSNLCLCATGWSMLTPDYFYDGDAQEYKNISVAGTSCELGCLDGMSILYIYQQ